MYFTDWPYSTSLCPEVLSYLESPAQCTTELTLIPGRKKKSQCNSSLKLHISDENSVGQTIANKSLLFFGRKVRWCTNLTFGEFCAFRLEVVFMEHSGVVRFSASGCHSAVSMHCRQLVANPQNSANFRNERCWWGCC